MVKMWWIVLQCFVVFVVADDISKEQTYVAPEWQEFQASGGIHVGNARNRRFAQISQDPTDVAYQACMLPDGKPGRCRHLQHCMKEDFKDNFIEFMNYACIIKGTSIGACCPEEVVTEGIDSLAGMLPATAPREEENEAILKLSRAENRGCGLSTRAQWRLVGARPANPREWPWMASITPEGVLQHCGGVLITDRHVLTAAHCTRRYKAEELFVRLGEYDLLRTNDSRTYNFRVVEKRQHENYDHSNYANDIAILKLHRPAVFNTYVWPICLPPLGLDLVNESAIIVGWGTQYYRGNYSNVLREAAVPIWDLKRCAESFVDAVFDENLCAGAYEGGRDACQGDSGGPLMYQLGSGRWTVVGIVSWGMRCGEPNHPGVYARVDKYLRWILENTTF